MYDSYKEMSRAVGVRKPQEAQKAKAFVGYESSQRQEGRVLMIRLAKRTFREEIKRDWSCGKNISRIQLLQALWKQGSNDQRSGGVRSDATVVGRGLVAFSGCLGQCASTHNLYAMECSRETRAARRALLLPFEELPMVLRELVRFGPSIPVEAVKACALVGLHMMAEEDSWRTDSGSSFFVEPLE